MRCGTLATQQPENARLKHTKYLLLTDDYLYRHMLTEKIKDATLAYHQETEKILTQKLRNMRSVQDYVAVLSLFYSYFGGLEKQTDAYISTEMLHDYHERRKAAALAADINTLSGLLPNRADGHYLPVITNQLQAFGALYVMEGSTLGGKMISKMVQQHLGLQDGNGTAFFSGYAEKTGQKWTDFKAALNAIASNDAEEETVINAANETFKKLKQWMELPPQQPVY